MRLHKTATLPYLFNGDKQIQDAHLITKILCLVILRDKSENYLEAIL